MVAWEKVLRAEVDPVLLRRRLTAGPPFRYPPAVSRSCSRSRPLLAALAAPAVLALAACPGTAPKPAARPPSDFPPELVDWVAYEGNPLLAGTGTDTWDRMIRERGFVLREADTWRLWYTGYDADPAETMRLGYATSPDGVRWTRHPANPVFDDTWTEDVHVTKHDGAYLMFAEGRNDVAHLLTSADGVRWEEKGRLDVRTRSGAPLSPGPYGTPTVWVESGTWYLFYERGDEGVWLATSADRRVWRNVEDAPVIDRGPEAYDRHAVALNQVVRYGGRYYGVYHANADPEWKGPWTTCLAASDDLVHWTKYPRNPIIPGDHSSGILVEDEEGRLRLYTMHPEVRLWLPRGRPLPSPTGAAPASGPGAATGHEVSR